VLYAPPILDIKHNVITSITNKFWNR